ncbi:MAG: hypothetical protein ACK5JL_05820 [Candidatus Kapaibacterium sp.]
MFTVHQLHKKLRAQLILAAIPIIAFTSPSGLPAQVEDRSVECISSWNNRRTGFASSMGESFGKKSVVQTLKLSAAQKDEIRAIVASLPAMCIKHSRTLAALRDDYRLALLADEKDQKVHQSELQRIRSEMFQTQSLINDAALSKMREIVSLLSATQAKKLRELRAEERARIAKRRGDELNAESNNDNDTKIDTDNDISNDDSSELFSMHRLRNLVTVVGTPWNGEELFSPDEVFCYPERELWLTQNPRAFGGLSYSSPRELTESFSMAIPKSFSKPLPEVESMLRNFLRDEDITLDTDIDIELENESDNSNGIRRSPNADTDSRDADSRKLKERNLKQQNSEPQNSEPKHSEKRSTRQRMRDLRDALEKLERDLRDDSTENK